MKRFRSRRGTTLVEVMAAVLVLALTATAASAMFPLSAFLRDRSGGYARAAAILQRKIEQVRRQPFKSLSYANLKTAGIVDTIDASSATFTTIDQLSTQLLQCEGKLVITNEDADSIRVDISLKWKTVRGTELQTSAVTRVVNKGVWVRS